MESTNYRFAFHTDESSYEFDLVKSDTAKRAITVGGIHYSIHPADPDKERAILKIINSAEVHEVKTIGELAGHLKRIPNVRDVQISTTEKVYTVAAALVGKKLPETAKTAQKKELLVTPGVPIPNVEVKAMSIEERMHDLGIPGVSIAIIDEGKIIPSKSYGLLQSPDISSQAASISKVVTALTVLSLIQECRTNEDVPALKQKIDLKTPLSTLLDSKLLDKIDPKGLFRDKITLKHLLQHTSGIVLRDKGGNQMTGFQGYPKSEVELDKEIKDLEELLLAPASDHILQDVQKRLEYLHTNRGAVLSGAPPSIDDILFGKETANSGSIQVEMAPDTTCSYSGANTLLLQKILSDLSGKPFETLVQEQVFTPLSLSKQTTYHPDEVKTAPGYEITSTPVSGGRHEFVEFAAAGLYTTANDLAQIAVEIQNALSGESTIIGQELAKEMLTKQTTGKGPPCGLGVFVEQFENATYFIHPGSNRGFKNFFIANDKGQGAFIMTNSDNGEQLWEEIIKSIATAYKWKDADKLPFCKPKIAPEQISKETPKNEEWIQPFEGLYSAEKGLQFTIRLEEGRVIGQLTGEAPFPIHPIGPETAIYRRFTPGPHEVLTFSKNEADNSIEIEISGAVLVRKLD